VSDFADGPFLTGLAVTAGAVLLLVFATWLLALRIGRFNIIDVTWGLGFVTVALVALAWSIGYGDTTRRVLVAVLVSIWGLRLASYIAIRSRGKGEDPRYAAMLNRVDGSRARHALLSIYLTQAAGLWFISLPVQVAMFEERAVGVLTWVGTAVWLVGFFFESVGDWQLHRFKADPANDGQVMDRGLWRYTRHPNYFGDATMWWGLYLIAAQQLPGALTILSPILMTYLLVAKTGKPLLEAGMAERRPGYRDYIERTSGFFPLPPRPVSANRDE
jgi:steroid 5-alpha reductase family enzyme